MAGDKKKTAFVPLTYRYNVTLMFSDFCHLFFPFSSEVLLSAFRFNITLFFFFILYFFPFPWGYYRHLTNPFYNSRGSGWRDVGDHISPGRNKICSTLYILVQVARRQVWNVC